MQERKRFSQVLDCISCIKQAVELWGSGCSLVCFGLPQSFALGNKRSPSTPHFFTKFTKYAPTFGVSNANSRTLCIRCLARTIKCEMRLPEATILLTLFLLNRKISKNNLRTINCPCCCNQLTFRTDDRWTSIPIPIIWLNIYCGERSARFMDEGKGRIKPCQHSNWLQWQNVDISWLDREASNGTNEQEEHHPPKQWDTTRPTDLNSHICPTWCEHLNEVANKWFAGAGG